MSSVSVKYPEDRRSADHQLGRSWPSYFRESVEYRLASPRYIPPVARRHVRQSYGTLDELSQDQAEEHAFLQDTDLYVIDESPKSSFYHASFNAVNLLLGVGVLSLPFALRSSGYLIGIPLLVAFSLITNHTGKILAKCLTYKPGLKTYPDIGEAAFGKRGRIFIAFIFFTELFTACAMFIILVGDNLHKLYGNISQSSLMVLTYLVVVPSTWTSHLVFLSYFSVVGIISSFGLLAVLLFLGSTNPADDEIGGSFIHPWRTEVIADLERIPLAVGLIMVGFAGHAVFPSIYFSMKYPSQYPKMLDTTYVTVFMVYLTIAVLGYMMYGLGTEQEITLNLVTSNGGWVTTIIIWLSAMNPVSKFALTLNPVALSVEELLLPRRVVENSNILSVVSRLTIRTSLSAMCLFGALYVPHFARVTSFIGSLCSLIVSAIFPCAAYVKLCYSSLSKSEIILNGFLVVSCTFAAIIGTLGSFLSPVN